MNAHPQPGNKVTILFSLAYKHVKLLHFVFNNLTAGPVFFTPFCRHARAA
jgi:hypothetical protein